jgi:uncharacterized membrane protein YeaQ/YmgE (transglycosylase-associated protein family)
MQSSTYDEGPLKAKEGQMLINVIMWILFGALAGWIASLIMKTDAEQGAVGNIIIGIIGAFIGGFISRMFGGSGVEEFTLGGLFMAVLGAVILLFIMRAISGSRHAHQ